MPPRKKVIKKVIKIVRKAPPAAASTPVAGTLAPVEPAVAIPFIAEKEIPVVPDDSPAVEAEPVQEEEEKVTPMETEIGVKESGTVAVKEAVLGKKLVKKVRKVKKVIVRKVLKVKDAAKEVAATEMKFGSGMAEAESCENVEPAKDDAVAEEDERHQSDEGGDDKEDASREDDKGGVAVEGDAGSGSLEGDMSERRKRRKTEIFIGGLDRSAKEEDVKKVFGKVGDIVEVRMMMDAKTGKNKGYAFLRYATAVQAKQAVVEFNKVEVCGKLCGASAIEGNDTIFIGNIDKKWKKEDVVKLLKEVGIEKIDTVTVMPDPHNDDINRGFAFLELETNRDAQLAYKKLQKKDAFGVHKNIKVAWATPLNEPDEEDMQKVKSVYAEGIPSTWSEGKVRAHFGKFGEIERVVLSRNIQSAKRKDFAFVNYTTREAALSCVESFDKESSENESKEVQVNIKVSLAKPVRKVKQNKGTSKSANKEIPKERPKAAQAPVKASASSSRGQPIKRDYGNAVAERKSSTTAELLHVLREQASWEPGQMGYAAGPAASAYPYASRAEKRPYSSLGEPPHYSDPRNFTRARLDAPYHAAPSMPPSSISSAPQSYFQRASAEYGAGAPHASNSAVSLQGRYSALYAGNRYGRY